MRYVITQSQLHSLVYKYLDDMFSNEDFRKELNPYVKDGNTWRIDLFDTNKKNSISYFWFGPGTYDDDDDTPHNGVGSLHISPNILDTLRKTLSIRESKIIDIVADWVSEKLNVDIDEISIYPDRRTPPVY